MLLRPRIRGRHGLDEEEIDRILLELARLGAVREPEPAEERSSDRADQHRLDLVAMERGAVLVTGDEDLAASPGADLEALSPRAFVERIGSKV